MLHDYLTCDYFVSDIQAPDFSNVVMESLDRVGQVEGTQLVGSGGSGDGMQMQQPPFPVMLHSNAGMSSPAGPVPGPSDPQTAASTSGGKSHFTVSSVPWLELVHQKNLCTAVRQFALHESSAIFVFVCFCSLKNAANFCYKFTVMF